MMIRAWHVDMPSMWGISTWGVWICPTVGGGRVIKQALDLLKNK